MKGFDLYRIALAYLCVIFAMCAVVVFQPLRWIWPAGDPAALQDVALPLPAVPVAPLLASPPAVALTATEPALSSTDRAAPTAERLLAAGRVGPPMSAKPDAPDETAELVARLVAQSFADQLDDQIGEGDASGQLDFNPNHEAALVASGSDVTYTVGLGDSLGALALRFYGDSALSSVIFEANRGLMGSPDQLRVGQVLIIPGRS